MIDLLNKIKLSCPADGTLLGMDIGKKTIGLAISSPNRDYALPLQTIKRTKFTQDLVKIETIIKEHNVTAFILGLPINMDGTEGPRAQSTRDFALELSKYENIVGQTPWIALQDERLSTASVEEIVDKHVEKRKTKIKAKSSGLIDKLAAQKILQSGLDILNTP